MQSIDHLGSDDPRPPHDAPSPPQFSLGTLLTVKTVVCVLLSIPGMGWLLAVVFGPSVAVLGVLIVLQIPVFFFLRWLWSIVRAEANCEGFSDWKI